MCQFISHVRYLVPYSTCLLIYVSSRVRYLRSRPAIKQLAHQRAGHTAHQRIGCSAQGSSPTSKQASPPWAAHPLRERSPGVAHPRRVGPRPGAACLQRPRLWHTRCPLLWILLASFFYMHSPLCTSPLQLTSTSEFLPHWTDMVD